MSQHEGLSALIVLIWGLKGVENTAIIFATPLVKKERGSYSESEITSL
jgi:hypothetical protein